MSIAYKINEQFDGIEVKFTEKPSREVLDKLKANGFRWSQNKGIWYAKRTDERLALVKSLVAEQGEQMSFDFGGNSASDPLPTTEKKAEPKKAEPKAKQTKKSEGKKTIYIPQPTPKAETKAEPKAEKKVEKKAEPKAKAETGKSNIIVFPSKERPKINKAITEGNATFEDCYNKLAEENKNEFHDGYDKYVLEGILAMCKASQNFRNNVMNPKKTLLGSLDYMEQLAKEGYAFQHNGTRFFNSDLEIAFSIDYFNSAEGVEGILGQAKKEVGI